MQWKDELLPGYEDDRRPFTVGYREFPITQLPARDGVPHGHVQRSARRRTVPFSQTGPDLEDSITWDVEVATAGKYEAVVNYTCAATDVGSTVELTLNGSRIRARVSEAHDPPLQGAEHDRVPAPGRILRERLQAHAAWCRRAGKRPGSLDAARAQNPGPRGHGRALCRAHPSEIEADDELVLVWNNERKGPVEQVEFDRLIQQGVIGQTTLVWREGMAESAAVRRSHRAAAQRPAAAGPVRAASCARNAVDFAPDEVIRLGGGYVCAACKPIATQKLREGVLGNDTAEHIRNEHLKHEASLKSVGVLYFLSATFLLLGCFGMAISAANDSEPMQAALLAFVLFGFAAVLIWAGIGLRRLKPWARIPVGVISGLGLLGFPVGTLINAYVLFLLFSTKGRMVFSPEYHRVMQETPHIKYPTSIVLWILLRPGPLHRRRRHGRGILQSSSVSGHQPATTGRNAALQLCTSPNVRKVNELAPRGHRPKSRGAPKRHYPAYLPAAMISNVTVFPGDTPFHLRFGSARRALGIVEVGTDFVEAVTGRVIRNVISGLGEVLKISARLLQHLRQRRKNLPDLSVRIRRFHAIKPRHINDLAVIHPGHAAEHLRGLSSPVG